MTILRVEVCQRCHEIGKPIEKYRIGDAEHLFRFPLCKDCVKTPLSELLALEPRPRRRAPNVPVTMEDVAKAKKSSSRRPPVRVKRTR